MALFIKVIIACLLLTVLFGCTAPDKNIIDNNTDINKIILITNPWPNYIIPTVSDINLLTPTTKEYEYFLGGQMYTYKFTVYKELNEYLNKYPGWYSCTGKCPTYEQYINILVNEPVSKKQLVKITSDFNALKLRIDDKIRSLVSFVQLLDYNTNKPISTESFPYQVLVDSQGICGEKSILLLNLLSNMGYKTAYLYFPDVNHAAVGIGCDPKYDFRDSGYCYIETTHQMIITDSNVGSKIGNVDVGTLTIFPISDGRKFNAETDYNAVIERKTFIAHKNDPNFDFTSYYYFNTYWGLNQTTCDTNLILCMGICWTNCSSGTFKCTSNGATC